MLEKKFLKCILRNRGVIYAIYLITRVNLHQRTQSQQVKMLTA